MDVTPGIKWKRFLTRFARREYGSRNSDVFTVVT